MIKMYVPAVKDQEGMLRLIKKYRLIPFFVNPVPGFSIEEHTPIEFWFTEEHLGPWDWKIECVQSGDIAYGKFLYGGKAAFATVGLMPISRRCLNTWMSTAAFPFRKYVNCWG